MLHLSLQGHALGRLLVYDIEHDRIPQEQQRIQAVDAVRGRGLGRCGGWRYGWEARWGVGDAGGRGTLKWEDPGHSGARKVGRKRSATSLPEPK